MTDKSDKGFSESRGPKKQKSKANKWINYKSAIAFGLIIILLVGGLEFYQYVGETNKREETIMKTELYIPSIEVMFWGEVDENGEPIEAEYKYSTEESIKTPFDDLMNFDSAKPLSPWRGWHGQKVFATEGVEVRRSFGDPLGQPGDAGVWLKLTVPFADNIELLNIEISKR